MTRSRREPPADNHDREPDPEEVARTIVLDQLTGQARSRADLERVLARRGVPEEVAGRVLDRMTEVGLVDDEKFAHAWVESRQRRRHLSRTAVRQELRRKGIDGELVDQAVAEVGADDEHAAARELAVKKLRSMSGLDPVVRRRRLAGALARRGFGSGVVYAVLDEVLEGDEDSVPDWS